MRATYLRLKNFAGVFSALKKKEVQLDLSLLTNRIVLFIGANGSGKTTLLSTIHPFAYPGAMDIRNGSEIILKGEQGLKEIHFIKGTHEIKIKHVYTPTSTGHSVKSFITVDGEEKNPNGNVTSFVSMVTTFLDIELDYLKLTRLGANVTGLINMKSTERKSFTSQLLSEVDVYSEFYKKINNDTRELKVLLKSLSDKLAKLNINDKDAEIKEINNMKEKLFNLQKQREERSNNLSIIMYKLDQLKPESGSFTELISNAKKEYKNCQTITNEILNELSEMVITCDKETVQNEYKKLFEQQIIINEKINHTIESIDKLFKTKQEYEIKLMQLQDMGSIDTLLDTKAKITSKIESLDKLPKPIFDLPKDTLLSLLSLAQEVERILGNISAYDDTIVLQAYKLVTRNERIENYVYRNVEIIDKKLASIDRKLIEYGEMNKTDDEFSIMFSLCDDANRCPYYKKVTAKEPNKVDTSIIELKSKKQHLLKERETFLSLTVIKDYIVGLMKSIGNFQDVLTRLKTNPFVITNLIRNRYVDTHHIQDAIEYCELQEEKKGYQMDLLKIDNEITHLSSTENVSNISNLLNETNKELEELQMKLETYKVNKSKIDMDLLMTEKSLNMIDRYDELMLNKETYLTKTENMERELQSLLSKEEEYHNISKSAYEIKSDLDVLDKNIKMVEDYLQRKNYNLHQYEELTKESEILGEKYDELNILREALSSSKGIPLLFIQLYLKNTRLIANKLLKDSDILDGDLEISEFVINEKEFKIPYTRHGIEVHDIISASQGETTFISLALSFALIQQSLKSYNIMLLDEVDSTLDQRNRNTFIAILEQQLEEINCEQAFMITHNNVFDSYPVDIIQTSDVSLDNYKNIGTILKVY